MASIPCAVNNIICNDFTPIVSNLRLQAMLLRGHQKFPIFLNASETSDADVSDAFIRVQTCFQTFSDVADTSDFQSVGKHLNIPSSVLYPSAFAITVDLCIRKTSWQNLLPVIRSGRAGLGSAMSNMAASTQVLRWTTCKI